MGKKDSKKLWLKLGKKMPQTSIKLGPYTTDALLSDPALISFISSRYKFCAKMLTGLDKVVEVGVGDGFGSALVAQRVGKLIGTDINEELLEDNQSRMSHYKNITFKYHDFRLEPFHEKVEAIYLVDVIEHIYPEEESDFIRNITGSLVEHGICLIGTPNIEAEKFSSKFSKEGHVNLKDHEGLRSLGDSYFHRSFLFSMNDEVIHTGFSKMAHFLWALYVSPKN